MLKLSTVTDRFAHCLSPAAYFFCVPRPLAYRFFATAASINLVPYPNEIQADALCLSRIPQLFNCRC